MKRSVLALLLVGLVGLVGINTWQAYRYYQLESRVSNLLAAQQRLAEANRQALAEIAELRSPARILPLAEAAGLEVLPDEAVILLRLHQETDGDTGGGG